MLLWTLAVRLMAGQLAQTNTGELHVIVTDTAGCPSPALLTSRASPTRSICGSTPTPKDSSSRSDCPPQIVAA